MSVKDETRSGPPVDFAELRQQILDERKKMPKRLSQVAAFSLDNPDEIAFGTAASIAASVGVQPSTLVRFARHVGFDGFTSLQSVFRERLRDRNSSYDERLSSLQTGTGGRGGENLDVLKGFMGASVRSINTLAGSIDGDVFDDTTKTLADASIIYIVAKRRSFPVASYLAYIFGKLNVRNVLLDSSSGLDPETISFATPRDAAIAISFSPYSQDTITYASNLSARGVPVIGITDSVFSPLSEFSNNWFEVVESDFGGFRSLAASMSLAAALAIRVAEIRRLQLKE